MSEIVATSLAAGVTSSVTNTQFKISAEVVQRKILIIGTGDPLKEAGISLNTPIPVTSPEDVGNLTGFGWMLHRLSEQVFKGSKNSIEAWIIMQAEDAGTGVQASGEIDFVGSSGVLAGKISLYISGILNRPVEVAVTDAMTDANIAAAVNTAINAIKELPVTSSVLTTVVTIDAKSVGTWGNNISIAFNLKQGEELPFGVTAAITGMASGAGVEVIATALNSLGIDDNANENFFTDGIHGYGADTTSLDVILAYIGAGNDKVGCWSELVHKPFRFLTGDVVADSAGLTAIRAIGDGRKTDRANGTVSVPGSNSHPEEIAAQAMGIMARINNKIAGQMYVDLILEDIDPGDTADRWSSLYLNRDLAVKSGISPTFVISGKVVLQNVVTYYHPDSVPQTSNGYREMANIALEQNLLDSQFKTFNTEIWKRIKIVEDATKVGNAVDREKVRDIDSVIDANIALIDAWMNNGWLYNDTFPKEQLKSNPPTVRSGGDGFNNKISVILRGIGNILDNETEFDVSIAILS